MPSVSRRSRSCSVLVSTWHQTQYAPLGPEREKKFLEMDTRIKLRNSKQRRWFHSSFEKLPLVRTSALPQCSRDREQMTHPDVVQHQRNDFRLCRTVRHRNLFLAHPTHWDNCSASKNTQDTTRSWFWVLKVAAKSESWNKPNLQCCAASHTWQYWRKSLCVECMKSSLPTVCHMPESILWLLLQIWWQTIKNCQVVQFVSNTSMTRQFVSKLLIILQQIQVPPVYTDDHPNKDVKLCKVAPHSCLPIQSIARRILWAVLPCRRTTLLFCACGFWHQGNFCCSSSNMWFKHLRKLFNGCFIRFAFTLSASQIHMVKKWCGFVNIHIFRQFVHMGAKFCFLPTNLMSPTFPNPSSNKACSNCLSQSNPTNGWPYNVRSRNITGSLLLHSDFCHVCRGKRIQTSGHSDFGILSNLGASSQFFLGKAQTSSTACPLQSGNLAMTSMILQNKIMRALQSRLLQCLSRSTTLPWNFCNLGSNSAFFERWHMSINVAKWTLSLYLCAWRIASFLLLTFFQIPCWSRLELFPFLVHSRFGVWNFHCLWHRDKLVHQFEMCHRRKSFSCNAIFMDFWTVKIPLVVSWIHEIPLFRLYIVLDLFSSPILGFATTFVVLDWILLHGVAGAIGLSSSLLAFLKVSECSLSSGSIK